MLRISFAAAALVAGLGVLAAPATANAEPFKAANTDAQDNEPGLWSSATCAGNR